MKPSSPSASMKPADPNRRAARFAVLLPALVVVAFLPLQAAYLLGFHSWRGGWGHVFLYVAAHGAIACIAVGLFAGVARRAPLVRASAAALWLALPPLCAATPLLLRGDGYAPSFLVLDALFAFAMLTLAPLAIRPSPLWSRIALSALALALPLAVVELALAKRPRPKPLPDYLALLRAPDSLQCGPGGRLKPNIDEAVQGEFGPVRWKTNSSGFRYGREVSAQPSPDTFRILYVGDSFVVGVRTDQERFSAQVLERRLNEMLRARGSKKRAEVLAAGVEDPANAWYYLDSQGFAFQPDLVICGFCLANDILQIGQFLTPSGALEIVEGPRSTTLRPRGKTTSDIPPEGIVPDRVMPPDYFRPVWPVERRWRGLVRRYAASALGSRIAALIDRFRPMGITTFRDDGPGLLHISDLSHGLAFCARPLPRQAAEGYERTRFALAGLKQSCDRQGVPLTMLVIPQRYSVSDGEWRAALRRYALRPERFDPQQPLDTVIATLEALGVPHVNLAPVFRAQSRPTRFFMGQGDMHWNDAGHALAGEALARAVAEQIDPLK